MRMIRAVVAEIVSVPAPWTETVDCRYGTLGGSSPGRLLTVKRDFLRLDCSENATGRVRNVYRWPQRVTSPSPSPKIRRGDRKRLCANVFGYPSLEIILASGLSHPERRLPERRIYAQRFIFALPSSRKSLRVDPSTALGAGAPGLLRMTFSRREQGLNGLSLSNMDGFQTRRRYRDHLPSAAGCG